MSSVFVRPAVPLPTACQWNPPSAVGSARILAANICSLSRRPRALEASLVPHHPGDLVARSRKGNVRLDPVAARIDVERRIANRGGSAAGGQAIGADLLPAEEAHTRRSGWLEPRATRSRPSRTSSTRSSPARWRRTPTTGIRPPGISVATRSPPPTGNARRRAREALPPVELLLPPAHRQSPRRRPRSCRNSATPARGPKRELDRQAVDNERLCRRELGHGLGLL